MYIYVYLNVYVCRMQTNPWVCPHDQDMRQALVQEPETTSNKGLNQT